MGLLYLEAILFSQALVLFPLPLAVSDYCFAISTNMIYPYAFVAALIFWIC